jgi:hypothetical protein
MSDGLLATRMAPGRAASPLFGRWSNLECVPGAQIRGSDRKNCHLHEPRRQASCVGPNALAEFIPDHERMVLIEGTAEIQTQKDNVLRFDARREQGYLPAVTIQDF